MTPAAPRGSDRAPRRAPRWLPALFLLILGAALAAPGVRPPGPGLSVTLRGGSRPGATAGGPGTIGSARARLARMERLYGPADPKLADTLDLLAQALWSAGDYAAERPVVEKAIALRRKAAGQDERYLARSLHYLAELQRVEGDYGAALQTREELGPMIARTYGPDHPQMAVHLHALASIEEAMGDYAAALEDARRALEIREKSLDPSDPLIAVSSNFVGDLMMETGDASHAEPFLRRAAAIWEKALGPDHPDVARALANLGSLLSSRGELTRALPLLRRALTIRSKAFGPGHILVARSLASLGSLERLLGHGRSARGLVERAIAIQESASVPSHPELAASLRELARLRLDEGRPDRAFDVALRAEAISRDHFLLTSGGLSEREALGHAKARASGLGLVMESAAALAAGRGAAARGAAARALDALIRSRALVLDVMASRRRILDQHRDGETANLVTSLREVKSRLAHLTLDVAAQDPSGSLGSRVREAEEKSDRLERALAERSREFRRERTRERTGLDEVDASLPPRSALVAYARYAGDSSFMGAGRAAGYVAFVLRSGERRPRIVPLGPARGVDEAAAKWRRQAGTNPHLVGTVVAERAYRRAARRLAAAIWDPVAPSLSGIDRVFIVPDGSLYEVSFSTLVSPDGDYYLETGPVFHDLAAERDLAELDDERSPGEGILAVGDPEFGREPGAGSVDPAIGGAPRFNPLPGARREVSAVVGSWEGGGSAIVLTGPDAEEDAFKRLAPGMRILHLGTHAFFTSTRREGASPAGNPLSLSGIALAGANLLSARTQPKDRDDGILTSEEIAAMDLGGVEWAVLSACETGAGDLQEGEGILGLRRAFRVAGVRTLIMSLWPVEDEATRYWMRSLYASRAGGASTDEAVRRASLDLLAAQRRSRRTTHPYYWGAFVGVGDRR